MFHKGSIHRVRVGQMLHSKGSILRVAHQLQSKGSFPRVGQMLHSKGNTPRRVHQNQQAAKWLQTCSSKARGELAVGQQLGSTGFDLLELPLL